MTKKTKETAEIRTVKTIQPVYSHKKCTHCNGTGEVVDNFGRRVKQLRVRKNISDGGLAQTLQISRRMLTSIERGTSNPNSIIILALANALDCTTDYLLGLSNSPKRRMQ